jgi:excisionase family DNA binding protein
MAGRRRPTLTRRIAPRAKPAAAPSPLVYTAQDVARFCEVDLKTIHHWADAGKIPHHRTQGRHLRFRRNHVVAFLREHGYPLHDALTSVRPSVFVAAPPDHALRSDEVLRKLATRFFVRRFDHAVTAIASLVDAQPDAIVCALDDPTWRGEASVAALKSDAETSFTTLVVLVPDEATVPGADLVLPASSLSRLHIELAKKLAVG